MLLRTLIALFLFSTFCKSSNAQSAWTWAKNGSDPNSEIGQSIATDSSRNSYVAGHYNGISLAFDTVVLSGNGSSNFFLVKYDASGNAIWARSADGNTDCYALGVSADSAGNTWVLGYFSSAIMIISGDTLFNTDQLGTSTDMFILKFDTDGNLLWSRSGGGPNGESVHKVTIDKFDNCFITGYFYSATVQFGSATLSNSDGSGASPDIYLVKYDGNGNVQWARGALSATAEFAYGVTTDPSGNVFIGGSFLGDSITFGTTTLHNNGSYGDIFLVKYDNAGALIWANSFGGASSEQCISVTSDLWGNIYMTGYFYSATVTFGSFTLTNADNTENYPDIHAVKLDNNGNVVWAHRAGGTRYDYSNGIATDNFGNVFIGGGYESATISFASSTLVNADNTGNSLDMYLLKFDSLGTELWAKSSGGMENDITGGLATDAFNVCHVTGYFMSPTITFGLNVLTNSTISTSFPSKDMFVAAIEDPLGMEDSFENSSIRVYPSPSTDGIFTIQSDESFSEILVRNTNGKMVFSKLSVGESSAPIDLSGQPDGMYFITVVSNESMLSQKIVISR